MTVERDSSVRAGAAAGASMTTAVLLVGALAAVYFISQFLRNSIGVIAPNLEAELGLGSESLGLLSSVFFFSFALAQIPIGILIDRFGPRAVMLGSLATCATRLRAIAGRLAR